MGELADLRAIVTYGSREPAVVRHLLRDAFDLGVTAVCHPLGFACVPLHRSPGVGVCLHVWAAEIPAPRLTTSPIHAHTWDLTSRVLRGAVRNELVDVTVECDTAADEPPPTHALFAVHSSGHVDEIRPTGRRVTCRSRDVQAVAAGQAYSLPSGHFHATRTVLPTATLVLAVTRRPPPELVLAAPTVRTHRVTRNTCSREQLRVIAGVVGADGRC